MALAVEQVRRMRGGAQSHLMRCSNQAYYVVKFQNNPQGLRILANELLGTRLAARPGAVCSGAGGGGGAGGADRPHRGPGNSAGARARSVQGGQAVRFALSGKSGGRGGVRFSSG